MIEEFPLLLLPRFEEITGKKINTFILMNYEYGKNFSGPGKDVFSLDRAVTMPKYAHKSNFLHPVLYSFTKLPTQTFELNPQDKIAFYLSQSDKKLHLAEDYLSLWNLPLSHQLFLRRFLEEVMQKDLRKFKRADCMHLQAAFGSFPILCRKYFKT